MLSKLVKISRYNTGHQKPPKLKKYSFQIPSFSVMPYAPSCTPWGNTKEKPSSTPLPLKGSPSQVHYLIYEQPLPHRINESFMTRNSVKKLIASRCLGHHLIHFLVDLVHNLAYDVIRDGGHCNFSKCQDKENWHIPMIYHSEKKIFCWIPSSLWILVFITVREIST